MGSNDGQDGINRSRSRIYGCGASFFTLWKFCGGGGSKAVRMGAFVEV